MPTATAADWTPLVERYLHPFSALSSDDVDRTQAWALNATAFAATGSWRAIFADVAAGL